MNWFGDMFFLFIEWIFILIIPLLIGIFIGWLLWYRKWKVMEEEVSKLEDEILIHEREVKDVKIKLKKSRKENSELIESKGKQEVEIKNLIVEKEDCEKVEKSLNVRISELENLRDDLRNNLKESDEEKLKLNKQIEGFETEKNELVAQIKEAESNKVKLVNQIEGFETEKNELVAQIKEVESNKMKLNNMILVLNNEKSDQKDQILELESALLECKEAQKSAVSDIARAVEEIEEEVNEKAEAEVEEIAEEAAEVINEVEETVEKELVEKELVEKDDLVLIEGLSADDESVLNGEGVLTYKQLASLDDSQVEGLESKLNKESGEIRKANWTSQAAQKHFEVHGEEIYDQVQVAAVYDNAFDRQLAESKKGVLIDYVDDLKQISGVGPKMEQILHDFGVKTFIQLSKFDQEGVNALNEKIDAFPGRIERDNWIGQAKELHIKLHE